MDTGASTRGRRGADSETAAVTPADAAYRELLDHADECDKSCMAGVNCDEAARLQRAWRVAKNEAMS